MSATIIQVQYDALAEIAARFQNQATLTLRLQRRLTHQMSALRESWVGEGAEAFFTEMEQALLPAVSRLATALEEANRTTQQIVTTFQQAEAEAAALFNGGSLSADSQGFTGQGDFAYDSTDYEAPDEIAARWAGLSDEERLAVLTALAAEISESYELAHVPVTVLDIPDPPGLDSRGYRNDNGVFLDIDNLSDPTIIATLAHEVRHEIQNHMADRVNPNAWEQLLRTMGIHEEPVWPDHGVTAAQAREWDENFDNYISPGDDLTAYRDQAVERDAREFGADYLSNLTLEELNATIPTPTATPSPPTGTTTTTTPSPQPAPAPTAPPTAPAPPTGTTTTTTPSPQPGPVPTPPPSPPPASS
ncbi:MAG: WXG100 family type VII secretion target [Anaerolineales bacterium]|nr:WXG100 family type VII secretion target [Anaerolineales bacterium]MCB9128761.1 WXG100 family type VII secretion target [Ardenticatenales bacterium]